MEELGAPFPFDRETGDRPFFLTVTETTGAVPFRHTDVSLWSALAGTRDIALIPDEREFRAIRWWSLDELAATDSAAFEPPLAPGPRPRLPPSPRARQQEFRSTTAGRIHFGRNQTAASSC